MEREKSVWYDHQLPATWRPELPEGSMFAFMEQTARRYPDLYALDFEGCKVRYRELLQRINEAAKAFQNMGVKAGDIVSVMAPNMPQVVYTVYALNRLGAVANMLHPLLSGGEVRNLLRHTQSKLLVVLDQLYDKIDRIPWEAGEKPRLVLLRVSDALPKGKKALYRFREKRLPEHEGCLYWNKVVRMAKNHILQPAKPDSNDTAVIMYSGGTTGKPKGVMLTNLNFNALALQSYDTMGIVDVAGFQTLDILPLFHGTGLGVCVHSMLCYGFQVYLVPLFDLNKCVKLIFRRKIEFIFGVPAFFEGIARSVEIEEQNCGFMRVLGSCGDKLPDRTRRRINYYLQRSGSSATITNGYGMTECTAGCCYEPYFLKKEGSSGMMVPDMRFKIVVPGTHTEVDAGKVGELCISGPTVMKGYYKNEEATQKTLQRHEDGRLWLHSGDAFLADEDGYLYFQHRLDRMFVVSGYNVIPSEIEEEILKVQGVAQCCVVGKKAEVVGRRTVAYLLLRPGADEQEILDQVRLQCRENLAEYAQPVAYTVLPEFPLTRMKKTDYKALERL